MAINLFQCRCGIVLRQFPCKFCPVPASVARLLCLQLCRISQRPVCASVQDLAKAALEELASTHALNIYTVIDTHASGFTLPPAKPDLVLSRYSQVGSASTRHWLIAGSLPSAAPVYAISSSCHASRCLLLFCILEATLRHA